MERKYHHNNLKTELIEQGLLMIQKEGIERLSLRKLARLIGVSEAAPYSHFKGKEDLLQEIQIYITDKLYDSLLKAYELSTERENPRCILEIGKEYVRFFIAHPTYFSFIFNQPCVTIDLSMRGENDFKPFALFRDKCYEIYRKGNRSDDEIKYGIIGMWAKVHGIASIASMRYVTKDFDWEDSLERIMLE